LRIEIPDSEVADLLARSDPLPDLGRDSQDCRAFKGADRSRDP
jgi:hypothetical protein